MSNFCTKCGAQITDENKFCSVCGAPVPTEEKVDPIQPNEEAVNTNSETNATHTVSFTVPDVKNVVNKVGKKKAAIFGIIGGAVAATILVLVLIFSLIFPSPKAVLKKGLDALIEGDAKQLVNTLPKFVFELDDDMDKSDYIDLVDEYLDDSYMEDVEYEIKKIDKLSSSDKKDIIEILEYLEEYNFSFDADDVTDFRKAKVRFDDGEETYTQEFTLIKYKGKWCIWYYDILY